MDFYDSLFEKINRHKNLTPTDAKSFAFQMHARNVIKEIITEVHPDRKIANRLECDVFLDGLAIGLNIAQKKQAPLDKNKLVEEVTNRNGLTLSVFPDKTQELLKKLSCWGCIAGFRIHHQEKKNVNEDILFEMKKNGWDSELFRPKPDDTVAYKMAPVAAKIMREETSQRIGDDDFRWKTNSKKGGVSIDTALAILCVGIGVVWPKLQPLFAPIIPVFLRSSTLQQCQRCLSFLKEKLWDVLSPAETVRKIDKNIQAFFSEDLGTISTTKKNNREVSGEDIFI